MVVILCVFYNKGQKVTETMMIACRPADTLPAQYRRMCALRLQAADRASYRENNDKLNSVKEFHLI
jgi:hypothetical protein